VPGFGARCATIEPEIERSLHVSLDGGLPSIGSCSDAHRNSHHHLLTHPSLEASAEIHIDIRCALSDGLAQSARSKPIAFQAISFERDS